MASEVDGALDLSISSSQHQERGKMGGAGSPVPSISSEGEGNNSLGVGSDGNDSDTSLPYSVVKPIAGQLPSSHFASLPGAKRAMAAGEKDDSNDSTKGDSLPSSTTPNGVRPFKMYPYDPLPMYSQLASAASTGVYPFPSMSMPLPGVGSVLDSALSFSTPLTTYLAQRRRRSERASSVNSNTSGATSPKRTSMESNSGAGSCDEDSDAKRLKTVPEDKKDEAYWERRRKNNDAAKRSRDARRAKEEEIAMKAAFLEQENLKLRAQVAILKNETAKLHYMLYNRV